MTTPQAPGDEPDRPEQQPPNGPPPGRHPGHDPYWTQPTPPPGEYPPPGYGSEPSDPAQTPPGGYQSPGPGYPPPAPPGGHGYPPPPPPGGGGGPVASDPNDPLFSTDFAGWWKDTMDVFGRSWQSIGALMLIGVFIPSWVVGTVYSYSGRHNYQWNTNHISFSVAGDAAPSLILGLLLGYLTAVAWTSSLRIATIEAAGGSVGFPAALSYGFKRGLPLWGWGILAYITISVGLVLCILPGLWAMVWLSLIAPITVFERTNSYTRSFRLVHSRFGPTLGRMAVSLLLALAYVCILTCIEGAIFAAFGIGNATGLHGVGGFIVVLVIQAIVSLLYLIPSIWLVGSVLCTYAGIRGRTEPVSAGSLAAEADR